MSKILVVDDDREMGRLLKMLLELEGHQVVVTRMYDEILPSLRQTMPDVAFFDVRVQDQETIPLVGQIRQEAALANVPIIMASGMDRSRECLQAGANCFMLKPFTPDALIATIKELLR